MYNKAAKINSSINDKIFKRFNRYILLDHIVDGGMATIFRAKWSTDQVEKLVAIKMIKKNYSLDDDFKRMFLDEVKVTFNLINPNIAQTYDYGEEEGQLFLVMEYVDGKNLKQYEQKLSAKSLRFPVDIAIHIIIQACQALHYACTLVDKLSGKKLGIIHRDISPHNIMLTFDGIVKVIDFGIAKASTNAENTKTGVIKGKISYLGPEYINGENLDSRYDQFALGITLWELLCDRKLFEGDQLTILRQIQKGNIPPPSRYNAHIPPELDSVVLKMLKIDRELRFKTFEDIDSALYKIIHTHFPESNQAKLKSFAQNLFSAEIEEDRRRLLEFGKIIENIASSMNLIQTINQNSLNDNDTQSYSKQHLVKEINKVTGKVNFSISKRKINSAIPKRLKETQEIFKNKTKIDPAKVILALLTLAAIIIYFFLRKSK